MRFVDAGRERSRPRLPRRSSLRARLACDGPPSARRAAAARRPAPHGHRRARMRVELRARVYGTLELAELRARRARDERSRRTERPSTTSSPSPTRRPISVTTTRRSRSVVARSSSGSTIASSRRALIADAVRAETRRGAAHLEVLHALGRDDGRTSATSPASTTRSAKPDDALASLAEAKALAPDDPEPRVAYGRAAPAPRSSGRRACVAARGARASSAGRRDARAARADRARERAPTRRTPRRESEILARRGADERLPVRDAPGPHGQHRVRERPRLELPSARGAGPRRRGRARASARSRSSTIPASQRVDVRLARVYAATARCSSRCRRTSSSSASPGTASTTTRARSSWCSPTSSRATSSSCATASTTSRTRNLFADYFGDLHSSQDAMPIARIEYVLITPASRQLLLQRADARGPHARPSGVEDGTTDRSLRRRRRRRAASPRRACPASTEVAPYLHVSTYETWEDVGRWYWGLIQRPALRRRGARAHGARPRRRRARRTRRRCSASTTGCRQHALRRPRVRHPRLHAVPRAADRPARLRRLQGQGVAHLHDAARGRASTRASCCVRTRRNGDIAERPRRSRSSTTRSRTCPSSTCTSTAPPSTAASRELPAEDQGVTVLLVGPERRRAPPHAGAPRRRRTRARARSRSSSRPTARRSSRSTRRCSGNDAAGYRVTPTRPRARAPSASSARCAASSPGLELASSASRSSTIFEKPVRYSYRAEVPQLAQHDGSQLRVAMTTLGNLPPCARADADASLPARARLAGDVPRGTHGARTARPPRRLRTRIGHGREPVRPSPHRGHARHRRGARPHALRAPNRPRRSRRLRRVPHVGRGSRPRPSSAPLLRG